MALTVFLRKLWRGLSTEPDPGPIMVSTDWVQLSRVSEKLFSALSREVARDWPWDLMHAKLGLHQWATNHLPLKSRAWQLAFGECYILYSTYKAKADGPQHCLCPGTGHRERAGQPLSWSGVRGTSVYWLSKRKALMLFLATWAAAKSPSLKASGTTTLLFTPWSGQLTCRIHGE